MAWHNHSQIEILLKSKLPWPEVNSYLRMINGCMQLLRAEKHLTAQDWQNKLNEVMRRFCFRQTGNDSSSVFILTLTS
jgi:hypothetical protein